MREILVAGQMLLTTDAIAREVLQYAQELSEHDRSDVVDIPVAIDGAITTCAVLLTRNTSMATLAVPGTAPGTLPGEDLALFELQRRGQDLRRDRGAGERETLRAEDAR